MALRTIRTEGDSVLEKVCRPVEKIDKRTKEIGRASCRERV